MKKDRTFFVLDYVSKILDEGFELLADIQSTATMHMYT